MPPTVWPSLIVWSYQKVHMGSLMCVPFLVRQHAVHKSWTSSCCWPWRRDEHWGVCTKFLQVLTRKNWRMILYSFVSRIRVFSDSVLATGFTVQPLTCCVQNQTQSIQSPGHPVCSPAFNLLCPESLRVFRVLATRFAVQPLTCCVQNHSEYSESWPPVLQSSTQTSQPNSDLTLPGVISLQSLEIII